MRFLQAREVAALPSLAPTEEILADTVSVHGQVAVLTAARVPPSRTPRAGSSAPATVYLHDGGWRAVVLDPFAVAHAHVDLLPDGDLLIVGARSQRHRARAYAPTPVRGARTVVVYDHDIVFIGEYNDPLQQSSCHRTRDTVEYHGLAATIGPDGAPFTLFRLIAARGSRLYLRTDAHIMLVDIADEPNRPG